MDKLKRLIELKEAHRRMDLNEDDYIGIAQVIDEAIQGETMEGAKVYKRETPDGTTQLECPKCHHEALKDWHHPHCWNCGQKLDWED